MNEHTDGYTDGTDELIDRHTLMINQRTEPNRVVGEGGAKRTP